jgi:hypothetical protein
MMEVAPEQELILQSFALVEEQELEVVTVGLTDRCQT